MNPPKFGPADYINFLIASPRVVTCTEAARVQPAKEHPPSHDAINRFLYREPPDPEALWDEAKSEVSLTDGVLVIDDTVLDKFYAHDMALVHRQWSGKHRRVVCGIDLISLLWTDGDRHVPLDWRVYDRPRDGKTKNDHFQVMIETAKARGFAPTCVAFDGWYSSLANLKRVRDYGWIWLTRFKANRLVDPDATGNRPLETVAISATGSVVHLMGYGFVKVFKLDAPNGDIEYWATNDLTMDDLKRVKYAGFANAIEQYHRGIKQYCGIERCQARGARAQRNHIALALRAFLRLELHCFRLGISWFAAKNAIIREAVRRYLAKPWYPLSSSA